MIDAIGDWALGQGWPGVTCLLLAGAVVKLYLDGKAKDRAILALAVKQAGASAEQSILMAKLVERTKP